jgi:hypothetical protein
VPTSAIAIGSWIALIPAAGFAAVVASRARWEDEFLRNNLPGYQTYASGKRRGICLDPKALRILNPLLLRRLCSGNSPPCPDRARTEESGAAEICELND